MKDLYSFFHDILNKGSFKLCDGSKEQLKKLCDRVDRFCDEADTIECEINYDSDYDVAQIGLVYNEIVTIAKDSAFWNAIDEAEGLYVESRDDYGEDGVQISFAMVCQKER